MNKVLPRFRYCSISMKIEKYFLRSFCPTVIHRKRPLLVTKKLFSCPKMSLVSVIATCCRNNIPYRVNMWSRESYFYVSLHIPTFQGEEHHFAWLLADSRKFEKWSSKIRQKFAKNVPYLDTSGNTRFLDFHQTWKMSFWDALITVQALFMNHNRTRPS